MYRFPCKQQTVVLTDKTCPQFMVFVVVRPMFRFFLLTVKSSDNNTTDDVHAQKQSSYTNSVNQPSPRRSSEQLSTKTDISTEMSASEAQSIIGTGNIAASNYD